MSKEEGLRTTLLISILCSPGPLPMNDALFCFVSIPVSGYSTVYLKELSRRETRRKEDSKVDTLIGDIGIFFYLSKNKIQEKIRLVKKIVAVKVVETLAGLKRC